MDTVAVSTSEETSTILMTNQIELKDQLRDYQMRGQSLQPLNLYEFIVNTYEDILQDDYMDIDTTQNHRRRGRPRNRRIAYLPEAEKPNKCRVERTAGHEILPRFVGQWFPRNNKSDANANNDLHYASILLLLKPWRSLTDLKAKDESFEQTMTSFLATATQEKKDMIENIQYYHDCWDVAQKRRDALRQGQDYRIFDYEREHIEIIGEENTEDEETCVNEGNRQHPGSENVDEQMIEDERLKQHELCDRLFAKQALEMAYTAKVFDEKHSTPIQSPNTIARRATTDDMQILMAWETILKDMTRKQSQHHGREDISRLSFHLTRTAAQPKILLDNGTRSKPLVVQSDTLSEGTTNAVTVKTVSRFDRQVLKRLNEDQKRAHDIIEKQIFGGEDGI